MGEAKKRLISSGFSFFRMTGLHHLAAPLTRGAGAILMFHRVRPCERRDFAPNRLLEITPEFLDAVLTRLTALGFAIVSLDKALAILPAAPGSDSLSPCSLSTTAIKIRAMSRCRSLKSIRPPFTLYVTTGFAERTARLWWVELEEAIRKLAQISVEIDGEKVALPSATAGEKYAAFASLYRRLMDGPEEILLDVTAKLAAKAGIDSAGLADELCLDWAGIEKIARNELCTIGVHTLTHRRLAKLGAASMRRELFESRRIIEAHIGRPAEHLAYPVGNRAAAGAREATAATDLGFSSAVTTRPGMIFSEHENHLTELPRLSINGNWQSLDAVEILLSGVPFALWNRGKRVA